MQCSVLLQQQQAGPGIHVSKELKSGLLNDGEEICKPEDSLLCRP